jgi:hypothetical protein
VHREALRNVHELYSGFSVERLYLSVRTAEFVYSGTPPSTEFYSDLLVTILSTVELLVDRLCGLVVRGPGSIPCATRFSEK